MTVRRRTWLTATSPRRGRICCGSPISPTFRPGPAFSMWRSCSMPAAVGWSMATSLGTRLVLDALNMALAMRRPKGVIHHSDQGSQYTSIEFGQRCRAAGVQPSMGSVGDAYDNAMCESFFATLECELLDRRRFKTQAEARLAVFSFIEGFYNPRRRHSSIGYLSPIEYEFRFATNPDARQSAVVLAAVKDKPFGRPPKWGRP